MTERPMKSVIGQLGEDLACKFLENKGFSILARNYREKWGELDIVTRERNGTIRFVEVKAVSREIVRNETGKDVLREKEEYRPEDQIHPWKQQRLQRIILSYLGKHKVGDEVPWQFDVLLVRIDPKSKKVLIDHWENMPL